MHQLLPRLPLLPHPACRPPQRSFHWSNVAAVLWFQKNENCRNDERMLKFALKNENKTQILSTIMFAIFFVRKSCTGFSAAAMLGSTAAPTMMMTCCHNKVPNPKAKAIPHSFAPRFGLHWNTRPENLTKIIVKSICMNFT